MVTKGLLVRLQARHNQEEEVERFLRSALPLVEDEPDTTAWFAIRFGRHEYGIFDVFPNEDGRQAHLSGLVAKGLAERSGELFAEAPGPPAAGAQRALSDDPDGPPTARAAPGPR